MKNRVILLVLYANWKSLDPDLHNSEGVLPGWVDSIMNKLDDCNGKGSGSEVLFIENLFINGCNFKKDFV